MKDEDDYNDEKNKTKIPYSLFILFSFYLLPIALHHHHRIKSKENFLHLFLLCLFCFSMCDDQLPINKK